MVLHKRILPTFLLATGLADSLPGCQELDADNGVEVMRALCYGGAVVDKRPIFQPIIMWVAVILRALF